MLNNDEGFLKHILEECIFLVDNLNNISYEDFFSSEILKRAAVRSIEIIGEASKKISNSLKERSPDVEWSDLAKMRDVLIHQYFGIDFEIVWDVVKEKIPEFQKKIEELLK